MFRKRKRLLAQPKKRLQLAKLIACSEKTHFLNAFYCKLLRIAVNLVVFSPTVTIKIGESGHQ